MPAERASHRQQIGERQRDDLRRVVEVGERQSLVGLVVGGGLRTSAAGIAIGLALAWLLAPLVGGWLYEVPPRDGGVFGTVALTLLAAAALASVIPGFRAARVDPGSALRDR